jgi:hypothetical protein
VTTLYLGYHYNGLDDTSGADPIVYDTLGYLNGVAQQQDGGKIVVLAANYLQDSVIGNGNNQIFGSNVMRWLADPGYGDVPWMAMLPESGTIGAHSSMEMSVTLDTSGMAVGTHHATLAFEHNDPELSSPVNVPVTLTLEAQTAAVSMSASPLSASGPPGSELAYTVEVMNMGNGEDSFVLTVNSDWQATLSATTTGVLQPGERTEVSLIITVPLTAADAATTANTLVATSTFDDSITESLTVSSQSVWFHMLLPVTVAQ